MRAGNGCLNLALRGVPWLAKLPTQAEIQRETGLGPPTILDEQCGILAPRVQDLLARLREAVGSAQQEVDEIGSAFAPVEAKRSIFSKEVPLVDLVVVKLAAELQAVRSQNLREVIENLVGVVVGVLRILRNTDREPGALLTERDLRHSFQCGVDRTDAAIELGTRAGRGRKAQRAQSHPYAAIGLEIGTGDPHEADMKLIDRCRAECLGVPQANQLRPARRDRIKPRRTDRAAKQSSVRKRIAPGIIIQEVVGRQRAEARITVEANAAFIVAQPVIACSAAKIGAFVRLGNERQEMESSSRKCARGNHESGENTSGRWS